MTCPEPRLSAVADWLPAERLAEEFQAVGFYLTGHPLDDVAGALRRRGVLTIAGLQARFDAAGAAVGQVGVLVTDLSERKSARGTRFFRMNVSDQTGQLSGIALFPDRPENFDAYRQVFDASTMVILTLEARSGEAREGGSGFDPVARSVMAMGPVVAGAGAAEIRVHVDAAGAVAAVRTLLDSLMAEGKTGAKAPVGFCLRLADREVELVDETAYPAGPQIVRAIKSIPGVVTVEEV